MRFHSPRIATRNRRALVSSRPPKASFSSSPARVALFLAFPFWSVPPPFLLTASGTMNSFFSYARLARRGAERLSTPPTGSHVLVDLFFFSLPVPALIMRSIGFCIPLAESCVGSVLPSKDSQTFFLLGFPHFDSPPPVLSTRSFDAEKGPGFPLGRLAMTEKRLPPLRFLVVPLLLLFKKCSCAFLTRSVPWTEAFLSHY